MTRKFNDDNDNRKLRIIRFFCKKLTHKDFSQEVAEEQSKLSENYHEENQRIKDSYDTERSAVEDKYCGSFARIKVFLFILILLLIGSIIMIANEVNSEMLFLGICFLVISILGGVVWLGWAFKKLTARRKEVVIAKSRRDIRLSNLEESYRKNLSTLEGVIIRLLDAWEDARALEEEVYEYIDELMADELTLTINEFLDISNEEIQDERCAEIWTPTFMQSGKLPDPVEIDLVNSKRDIYQIRYEIIQPLKEVFPENLSWESFSARILRSLSLDDSENLELSAYNTVHYYDKKKVYLAGSYFYQKIICTEDFISQYRCYINVLCGRIAFTQAVQIHYADISAIGIEASHTSEIFYDAKAIQKHVKTLSLELRSGSTYKMSGDAGSNLGMVEGPCTVYSGIKSRANKDFGTQIKNIRAFVLEAKGRNEGLQADNVV